MKLGSIPDPFSGEKIAAIHPRPASFVEDPERLARLHYFPGRHLTAHALQREQAIRTRRLGLRGQAVTHGVVSGLELGFRQVADDAILELRPGQALTSSGLDMVVDRTVEVPVASLPFIDPATLETTFERPAAPFVAVLLLQPGYLEDADLPLALQREAGTDFTPGPRVPEDEVYYQTTVIDASRLVLYPLPDNEPAGGVWQNRAAWSVFNRETQGLEVPWHEVGVALALCGFYDDLEMAWIDRHAVVRPAGKPRQRVLIQPDFDARTWPARFDQFCAQLGTLHEPLPASLLFHFLPPIGLLPKAYLTLANTDDQNAKLDRWQLTQRFFPAGYTVDVGVVPLEQLDALLADTLRLQPYDLSHLDAVRLLLPVAQQWFDPDLLQIEKIDPQFAEAVTRFRAVRGSHIARVYDLGNRRRALELSLDSQSTPYPLNPSDPDPKRLEAPEVPLSGPPGEALQFEVTRADNGGTLAYQSAVLTRLRADADAFVKEFSGEDIREFGDTFNACGLGGVDRETVNKLLREPDWIATVSEAGTDTRLNVSEKNELRRELIAYLRKQIQVQEEENAIAATANIQKLIAHFEARADEADELVEAGFLKARTDVFRLGQLLNNNSLGTQFVASPTLANIVERKPAKADAVAVNGFASQLLGNFAPSALQAAAPAAPAPNEPNPNNARATLPLTLLVAKPPGALSLKLDAIAAITPTFALPEAKSDLDALQSVIQGSTTLTAGQKKVFTDLKAAGQLLDPDVLQEVSSVGRFAEGYVENFNQLSQKQLRAIPLDRLQPALAPTVRQEIHDGRLEIFERLARLNLSLGDLTTDFVDTPGTLTRPALIARLEGLRFPTLLTRRFDLFHRQIATADQKLETITDADESKHFSTGVSYADMAMAALRAVEKRIKEYRAFVETCRRALQQTRDALARLNTELASREIALDEARQDVAVALAIQAEETARLEGLNAHRARVLTDHVEFLVFCRPRAVKLNADVPSRRLEPALAREPVIECLRENPVPPTDLAALRDLFRASPARWFRHAPQWIARVDRWEQLRALLDRASRTTFVQDEGAFAISSGRYSQALGRVFQTRQSAAQEHRLSAQAIVPATLASLSWRDLQQQAEQQLTLGHLIAAGPAPLARAAAEELDDLFAVATCLHGNFSAVPGLVRLDWAERLGQFDQVSLDGRDLSRLPSWQKIDFTLRREMQLHADWLFDRVDQTQTDALDLINDLIRVALLLASHAPVDQLVVGQPLEDQTAPTAGGILKLKVDPLRVRRGMDVTCRISATQTLRAVVEDISASHVAARIQESSLTDGQPVQLTTRSNFHFHASRH